jgi:DNA-binding NtrC family response regulator
MNGASLAGRSILIVEDEYLLADDLSIALRSAGAKVVGPCNSVAAAFSLLESGVKIDAAILDIDLNGHKIFPVADAMMARGMPFVFSTGYDGSEVPARYDHIVRCEKPMNVTAVASSLALYLGGMAAGPWTAVLASF